MKRRAVPLRALLLLHLVGASPWPVRVLGDEVGDRPVPEWNEVVMAPGMQITATTAAGDITVTAGKGLKRSYTWEGATRSVEMWPRIERWYGSLGLYFPGPGEHWQEHKGISRCVVQEGQQHFKTLEEALAWLDKRKDWMSYVRRSDGLVVGWGKTLERKQLNVEVWQLYVNGKKPAKLPGSQDEKIVVKQPKEPAEKPEAGQGRSGSKEPSK